MPSHRGRSRRVSQLRRLRFNTNAGGYIRGRAYDVEKTGGVIIDNLLVMAGLSRLSLDAIAKRNKVGRRCDSKFSSRNIVFGV